MIPRTLSLFIKASSQVREQCIMKYYDVKTATAPLDEANWSTLLYFYGHFIVHAAHCQLKCYYAAHNCILITSDLYFAHVNLVGL